MPKTDSNITMQQTYQMDSKMAILVLLSYAITAQQKWNLQSDIQMYTNDTKRKQPNKKNVIYPK